MGDNKDKLEDMFNTIKKCYNTIIVVAGDEKKEFLDKEVAQVEDKLTIIGKCDDALGKLYDYNEFLTKTVHDARELRKWAEPTQEKLNFLRTTTEMTVEDITKERLVLKDVKETKFPLIAPLDQNYSDLLQEFDLEKSSTARKSLEEWHEIKALASRGHGHSSHGHHGHGGFDSGSDREEDSVEEPNGKWQMAIPPKKPTTRRPNPRPRPHFVMGPRGKMAKEQNLDQMAEKKMEK